MQRNQLREGVAYAVHSGSQEQGQGHIGYVRGIYTGDTVTKTIRGDDKDYEQKVPTFTVAAAAADLAAIHAHDQKVRQAQADFDTALGALTFTVTELGQPLLMHEGEVPDEVADVLGVNNSRDYLKNWPSEPLGDNSHYSTLSIVDDWLSMRWPGGGEAKRLVYLFTPTTLANSVGRSGLPWETLGPIIKSQFAMLLVAHILHEILPAEQAQAALTEALGPEVVQTIDALIEAAVVLHEADRIRRGLISKALFPDNEDSRGWFQISHVHRVTNTVIVVWAQPRWLSFTWSEIEQYRIGEAERRRARDEREQAARIRRRSLAKVLMPHADDKWKEKLKGWVNKNHHVSGWDEILFTLLDAGAIGGPPAPAGDVVSLDAFHTVCDVVDSLVADQADDGEVTITITVAGGKVRVA